jgi:hypothetical protein
MSNLSFRVQLVAALLLLGGVEGRRVQSSKRQTQSSLVQDVLSEHAGVASGEVKPEYAFYDFFKAKGYSKEEIAKLMAHFLKSSAQDGADVKWPMRDHVSELRESCENPANELSNQVRAAGGCADGLSKEIANKAEALLNKQDGPSSLLQRTEQQGASRPFIGPDGSPCTVALMSNDVSVLSGYVANNAFTLASLGNMVASNSASLASLTGQIGVIGQVTAPTVGLATTLGVSTGTVSALALAGSFVGPLIGVIALIYVTWPEEEIDPWLAVEARVSRMITDKFDVQRRKRLGDRLRRYVRQYSQCAKAWVASSMVKSNGISLPKWIIDDAESAKHQGNFNFTLNGHDKISKIKHNKYPAPPCMEELEGHMSIERDEWFQTESFQVGGLFMPFANMHTQMLQMLADHPYDIKMEWKDALQSTAAEYGTFMLEHMLNAWNAQVCRSVRLRESWAKGSLTQIKYQFTVLKPKYQPNAGQSCSSACSSGWCDFCGGEHVGACCGAGSEDPVCKSFGNLPQSSKKICIHMDCIQTDTKYTASNPVEKGETPGMQGDECQQLCQEEADAVAFSLSATGKCTCLKQEGLEMHAEPGSQSGPATCAEVNDSLEARETAYANMLKETTPEVPIEEIEPCRDEPGKSNPASNIRQVEQNQKPWLQTCLKKATGEVMKEYNRFYKRMAKFVDTMAWQAGCVAQREVDREHGGWLQISQDFDAGSFQDCNWAFEKKLDEKHPPEVDEERSRGWTGTNKINMDTQATIEHKYPMPSWLWDLKRQLPCLKKTAGGQVADISDGRSTAVENLMHPVKVPESEMRKHQINV